MPATLPTGKERPVAIEKEAGWASQLVWTFPERQTLLAHSDFAMPAPNSMIFAQFLKWHILKLSQGSNRRHKLNSATDETLFNIALNITAVISVHFCNQCKHRFCIRDKICPSVFRIVAMFVAVNWQTILRTKCMPVFTIHHHTKLHKASFNDPLDIVNKRNDTGNVRLLSVVGRLRSVKVIH
jgi:hypothetical protein